MLGRTEGSGVSYAPLCQRCTATDDSLGFGGYADHGRDMLACFAGEGLHECDGIPTDHLQQAHRVFFFFFFFQAVAKPKSCLSDETEAWMAGAILIPLADGHPCLVLGNFHSRLGSRLDAPADR